MDAGAPKVGWSGIGMGENSFLGSLSPEQYSLLSAAFERLELPAGTTICRQGAAAAYVYFLVDGKVSLTYKPYDGPPITLIQLHGGDVFGWSSVIGRSEYTSDAIAGTPVRAFRMRGAALRAICTKHPAAGAEILQKLASAVSPRWVHARRQVHNMLQDGIHLRA